MQATYEEIAAKIANLLESRPMGALLLIGITGPPGAGKSTTSAALQKIVPNSVVVPMDGYHYTKKHLDAFDDPVEAHARRGAHWTFDGDRFVQDLARLKTEKQGTFPAFSHGIGDPEEGAIHVSAASGDSVILIEGNYLTLDISPWDQLKGVLDYTYFLDCNLEVLEERIAKRHMRENGNTMERAWERVRYNDSPNAQRILGTKHRADAVIQSL